MSQPMTQPPAAGQAPHQKSFLRDTLEIVFLALVLYVVIQYAVQTVHVLGSSMSLTLHDNDLLVASKISYKLHPPQRGDIIVFKPPNEDSRDFIKRVIGLPGDKVAVHNDFVYINGKRLTEPYIDVFHRPTYVWPPQGGSATVPPSDFFVLGDNRNNSQDSHLWRWLPKKYIIGKAWVSYWPPKDLHVFITAPDLHLSLPNIQLSVGPIHVG